MGQTSTFRTRKLLPHLFICFFVIGIVIINSLYVQPIENTTRSLIAFIVAPLLILYANQHHLWFRSSFRFFVKRSNRLLSSMALFGGGVLVSYEVLHMIPNAWGIVFHLIILGFSSIIYWCPLILKCSFQKSRAYLDKLAYFTGTTLLFFIYHQVSFAYYESTPTLGFMIAGLITMLLTLIYTIHQWVQAEKKIDHTSAEGYIRPLKFD
ncbi:hypothetical protein MUO14_10340 [Halobacillus shinanisalinarum]|uniref:DUF2306 domain-containing protein n=1 Tax=Halobacillus shinanisalinarum TaxID=2932258 RepID=A0ABY4H553_9BACI|nr:hypothetical protein [Halobacillus shinanisalinarum]UOQ95283.1 hypothetical protein MUO14_10340 [Halobacillus shinanisalinarum]